MPYTPPAQRSPASSAPSSPILSRNHSYSASPTSHLSPSSPSAAQRPVLPHSHSSASYLSRHRRTPSISQTTNAIHNGTPADAATRPSRLQLNTSSNRGPMTSASESTPPDSNSDDEERGRQSKTMVELQQALSGIELKRGHSPNRDPPSAPAATQSSPTSAGGPVRPALTPEARKISHSRSSSEINLSSQANNLSESPIQTTDDSDDDNGLNMKPPLLRKKSGELVKPALRPSSRNRRRPSSMPGTPSFSKAVHFNEDIEQVRHFLQVDRPIAVSAGSSPVETYESETEYPFGYDDTYAQRRVEWEIRLANFPRDTFERKTLPVRCEKIFLAPDNKTLIGQVAVANLAFNKLVVARFTLDYWKTTSEVVAEYNTDVRKKDSSDGCDRFNFSIKLADQANLETKTMLLCVRYSVNGQEYWDNNNAMNFQVDFTKKTPPKVAKKQGLGVGSLGAIPRSRHSPPTARPNSLHSTSADDDFGNVEPKYEFGSRKDLFGDSPNPTIRFKSKHKRGISFPSQANNNASAQAFSTRYDFGASLTAALSNAQTAMGDRSGLKPKSKSDYFARQGEAPTEPLPPSAPRPDTMSSEKPDLKSAEYNELIQKYCFVGFGSAKGSPQTTSPKQQISTDGTNELDSASSGGSPAGSGSNSPSPPKVIPPALDGTSDQAFSSPGAFLGRAPSPGPVTGSTFNDRTTTPIAFGYPYNMHGGILSGPHTPKAILG
ncbi:carbohydrate-binding module family 21 protein [Saccharata proteae CBS 121410]|uniref:Carbohydrate-binding module family 21 protein n=1 Tax=Saccharata proteae CBS 121410 TaxID=1314787 RepID=A0A9P4LT61_9PEZI|nr:carbohydrate-binding module family 21 protein [Saccharata proteae CBS 121410]